MQLSDPQVGTRFPYQVDIKSWSGVTLRNCDSLDSASLALESFLGMMSTNHNAGDVASQSNDLGNSLLPSLFQDWALAKSFVSCFQMRYVQDLLLVGCRNFARDLSNLQQNIFQLTFKPYQNNLETL